MKLTRIRVLGLVMLCAGLTSCVPLDTFGPTKRGELSIEEISSKSAIPKELGKALGVTLRTDNPDVAQLWFEKPDGTIVVLSVDCQYGRLGKNILVIPRS